MFTSNKTALILLDTPPVFKYDAAGNMTSDGKNQYTWNDEDRLASVTPVFPRHGDLKLTYTYDYQGRRVYTDRFTFNSLPGSGGTGSGGIPAAGGSWAAASRTFYQYQGWNVVGSTLLNFGSGGFTTPAGSTTYAWGVDLSGSLQGAGGVGGLLAMRDGAGALAEYHYDFNGNVVGLADPASPQLLAEYTYDPFGKRLSATGPLAAANPFRFSTKIEEETGWNYYGFRFYAPEIGRWPSRDPIGESGGVNPFVFVRNGVPGHIDLFGMIQADLELTYGVMQFEVTNYWEPRTMQLSEPDWRLHVTLKDTGVESDGVFTYFTGVAGLPGKATVQTPDYDAQPPISDSKWVPPWKDAKLADDGFDLDLAPLGKNHWKKVGVSINSPDDPALGPKGTSGRCVECAITTGHLTVNRSIPINFGWLETLEDTLANLPDKISPEIPTSQLKLVTGWINRVTTRYDRERIFFYLIICADGKRSVGLLNMPQRSSDPRDKWNRRGYRVLGSSINSDPGRAHPLGEGPYPSTTWIKHD